MSLTYFLKLLDQLKNPMHEVLLDLEFISQIKKIYKHIFIYKEETSEVIQNKGLNLWICRTQL